jgi:hypothetical protein
MSHPNGLYENRLVKKRRAINEDDVIVVEGLSRHDKRFRIDFRAFGLKDQRSGVTILKRSMPYVDTEIRIEMNEVLVYNIEPAYTIEQFIDRFNRVMMGKSDMHSLL